ncbi:MAG: DNA polymerase III subunit delta [Bacteroidales bacterium]|jgi:DNA polymerase-3 subunit delta|nr:DNA polymerase III subunit delta [Bacteroidales bacterium]
MVKYEDLVKKLQIKEFAPIYLLMGDEPFYIDRITELIEERVLDKSERDMNQEVIYGRDTTAGEVIGSALQFPFGAERRVIIVKEAQHIKDFDMFGKYAETPSPNSVLVLAFKKDKLPASKYKSFEKQGVVMLSEKIKDWNLSKWILNESKNYGFRVSSYIADLLAEQIGNDLNRIHNEFTKLKIILPEDSEITVDIVEQHIGISKEYNVFELTEALNKRDVAKANKIALNMAHPSNDVTPIAIVASLYKNFLAMLQYHLRINNDEATLTAIYGPKHPFIIKQNIATAEHFTITELRHIISLLRTADVKSKGVESNDERGEIIKELVYRILH